MGQILTSEDLIQRPPDKFWDGHPTRKEMQGAFNKIGTNQAEIMGMLDTFDLVLNCVCEKLNITRGELDAFVSKKAEEVKAWRAAQEEAQRAAAAKPAQPVEADSVVTNG
jgi:hypothetical protein